MGKVNTWIFALLAVAFFCTGCVMVYLIRNHFPSFYKEYRTKMIIATFCLTLPLFIRAINSNLWYKRKKYYHYYLYHFASMNSTYIILSSILPIIT